MNQEIDEKIVEIKTPNNISEAPEVGLMTDEKMERIHKKKQSLDVSYKSFLEKTISKIDYTSIKEQWLYYVTILVGLIAIIAWIITSFLM